MDLIYVYKKKYLFFFSLSLEEEAEEKNDVRALFSQV
jgi:hypothetical protein